MTIQQFLEALEYGPYAEPGGYPRYFVMRDGEAISFAAALAESETIQGHLADGRSGDPCWQPVACEINWEDGDLFCAHTSTRIESAYAEPEDDDGKVHLE